MTREVWITGVGLVSGLGHSAGVHFERLLAGESAVAPAHEASLGSEGDFLRALVEPIDRRAVINGRMLRKILSNRACFAVMAARDAVRSAGLEVSERLSRAGLFVGSMALEVTVTALEDSVQASLDSQGIFEMARFGTYGLQFIDPLLITRSLPNAGTGGIAIELQVLGPNQNVANGSISAGQAAVIAADAVASGMVDIAIAAGHDSLLSVDSHAEHSQEKRLCRAKADDSGCWPFDGRSGGYPLGEGAAALVFESRESAEGRGAAPKAVLTGWGQRMEMLGEPAGECLVGAAAEALRLSGCRAGDIRAVFGDALGVPADDQRELWALRQVFGEKRVGFFGSTPALGFLGAASAAFSLAHAALAVAGKVLPPTLYGPRACPPEAPAVVAAAQPMDLDRVIVWSSDGAGRGLAFAVAHPGALERSS